MWAQGVKRTLHAWARMYPLCRGRARALVPGDEGRSGEPVLERRSASQMVHDQFASGTVTFEFTKNYKFTILNNENVWAKAMNRVVNEKVPVEQAVDEMIARIKAVAGQMHPSGRKPRGRSLSSGRGMTYVDDRD
jgi:hypothetical protein